MGRIKGMKHKSDLRQACLTTFFGELRRHKCIWKLVKHHTNEIFEERTEAWRIILQKLQMTYSAEVLNLMKMSNIEGLKAHYRCHKDKRAKSIKTMASVTDPQRLLRLQSCLDNRLDFLDGLMDKEKEGEEAQKDDGDEDNQDQDEEDEPPRKMLRLQDFNDSPPPLPQRPLEVADFAGDAISAAAAALPIYNANRIDPGKAGAGGGDGDDDDDEDDEEGGDFLSDFVSADGYRKGQTKDKVHHFFEFLKAEVRELPRARQLMLMDSFFIQLTEARKWN